MFAMLARAVRTVAAVVESGPRSVLLTWGAKKRGAAQKLREFSALASLVRNHKPSVVVEIGSLHGGTLWAWCRLAAPDALLVSIDLPGGEFSGGHAPADAARLRGYGRAQQQVVLIRNDSHSEATLAELEEVLGKRKVDFLFIDGDHTYEGVKTDFEMYSRLVAPKGIVALHDILPHPGDAACEVERYWIELRATRRHRELVDLRDKRSRGQWGGIGVVFTQSDQTPV